MLTVLLALTASAMSVPNHPYLPTRPVGIRTVHAPFVMQWNSALDRLAVEPGLSVSPTNYEQWRRNGWPGEKTQAGKVQIPAKAENLRAHRNRSFSGFYYGPYRRYLPWHCVFHDRCMPAPVATGGPGA